MMSLPQDRRSASPHRPPLQEAETYSRMQEEKNVLREWAHLDSVLATRGSFCTEDHSGSILYEDRTDSTPLQVFRLAQAFASLFWFLCEAHLALPLPCYLLVRSHSTTRFPRDTPSPSLPFPSSRIITAFEEHENSYPPIRQVAVVPRHPSSGFAPPTNALASCVLHSPLLAYLLAPLAPLWFRSCSCATCSAYSWPSFFSVFYLDYAVSLPVLREPRDMTGGEVFPVEAAISGRSIIAALRAQYSILHIHSRRHMEECSSSMMDICCHRSDSAHWTDPSPGKDAGRRLYGNKHARVTTAVTIFCTPTKHALES